MLRQLPTLCDQTCDFVAEVRGTVGHRSVGNIESSTLLHDGGGGVLGVGAGVRVEPLVVRMVVAEHKEVLVALFSSPELDVVGLRQGVGLCAVDGRTRWTRDLFSTDW